MTQTPVIQTLTKWLSFIILCLGFVHTSAQIERIDPPNWFKGMENTQLELLLYGDNLHELKEQISIEGCPRLNRILNTDHADYLILQLDISSCEEDFTIVISQGKKRSKRIAYKLLPKPSMDNFHFVNESDVMYLLMPDRFANGNPENDAFDHLQEKTVNRQEPLSRHGGDLEGIIDQLPYLHQLGISALWLNPVQENNQPHESYHGYAITDHYRIDPRLGDLKTYQKLSNEAQKLGIKMVMDVVYNHWGNEHPLYKSAPFNSWVHRHDSFYKTSYRATTLIDPYAAQKDQYQMLNGWFDRHMPDMNTDHEHLATYMIQNTLWWVAIARLSALRIDTYAYPGDAFMQKLLKSVQDEFPGLFIFGETWVHGIPVQASFVKSKVNPTTSLTSVTDFQMYYALGRAWNENFGWTEGLNRIYYTLAQDFIYDQPNELVTFIDNHDLDRFLGQVNNDTSVLHSALSVLLTTRGIPCIYYGTELNWSHKGNHGLLRSDFPGGWMDDPWNAFRDLPAKGDGSTYDLLRKLVNLRKTSPAFQSGELIQFVPEDGIYAYFRMDQIDTFMIVVNQNQDERQVSLSRFREYLINHVQFTDMIQNKTMQIGRNLSIDPKSVLILKLE